MLRKSFISVFILIVVFMSGLAGCVAKETDNNNINAAVALESENMNNSIEDIVTWEPNKPVIEGINGVFDDTIPGPGKVVVSRTLTDKMKSYGYDDVLFHVDITMYYEITNTFEYKGKTLDEYRNDPSLVYYREQYDIWREEVYKPLDKERTAAEQRGEEYAQGWEKHDVDQLYRDYWNENQPEDVIAEYELAWERYNEADRAYMNWCDSPDGAYAVTRGLFEKECGRLMALGYDLKVETEDPIRRLLLTGYLSRGQVEQFSANEEYGYIIKWADCDNLEVIVASMSDTDKIEIEVRLTPYSWDEMMAAFKSAYPEEYEICVIEDARDPETPCPNPKEVQPAVEARAKFCQKTYFPQKLNAFREKYNISDEDYIMGGNGNTQEAPGCQLWADKALILKFLEDKDITDIRILQEAVDEND